MKKIIVRGAIALLSIFIVSSGFLSIASYTQQQTETVAHRIAREIAFYNLQPISFGNLLHSHLHAMTDDEPGSVKAGENTPDYYKEGIRLQIATNPQMVTTAMQMFGPSIISQINDDILKARDEKIAGLHEPKIRLANPTPEQAAKWAKDSLARINRLQEFTTASFWNSQKILISQYDNLIKKLLELPDDQLEEYIDEIGQEQKSPVNNFNKQAAKTAQWLLDNQFITGMPESGYHPYSKNGEQIWYLMAYPVDLLLFTYRINHDYPKWTHRRILLQAQSFSRELKKFI